MIRNGIAAGVVLLLLLGPGCAAMALFSEDVDHQQVISRFRLEREKREMLRDQRVDMNTTVPSTADRESVSGGSAASAGSPATFRTTQMKPQPTGLSPDSVSEPAPAPSQSGFRRLSRQEAAPLIRQAKQQQAAQRRAAAPKKRGAPWGIIISLALFIGLLVKLRSIQ